MYKIKKTYENTITIEKSVFITSLYRIDNVEDAYDILERVRKKYYDATHNCYAYILGDNQEIQKASDDGEPQKTAGFPMLDVLKKNNLTNVLAITTRYFGGILLGANGLVRAYSQSVSEVVKKCELFVDEEQTKFKFTTSYSGYNTLLKVFNYITYDDISFTTDVIITGFLKSDLIDKFKDDLYKYKVDNQALTFLGQFNIEIKKGD
ncbi:MAG: YigZ family protein [Acholeplasmatales bacterium]|nr:YigZ family protein [Acholeplasmatales bacterium]